LSANQATDATRTATEVADALGMSERTIRRAIERGDLRATKVGRSFCITPADLAAYRRDREASRHGIGPVRSDHISGVSAAAQPLPAAASALIGRSRETGLALDLLKRDDLRLLTMQGPGGVGKTRLALEVAGLAKNMFPGGVWWASLAALTDPDMVIPAILQVFRVTAPDDSPARERLRRLLRGRPTLLILDNLEQVIAAAPAIADLLSRAPELKILVTSRESLNVLAEVTLPIGPLLLPDPGPSLSVAQVAAAPAAQLFVTRVQAHLVEFRLNESNAEIVAEICRRVDGLPLAIELAATRLRLLQPTELLARLDRRLPVLTGGQRDAPDRHHTMRDAIAWSYDLLTFQEQSFFRKLAIFVGGASLEAVEAVCGGDSAEILCSLVDKSLIVVEKRPDTSSRVSLLETIREFAQERLQASDEYESLGRLHAEWFLVFIEETIRIRRSDGNVAYERIAREEANLTAAFAWFDRAGDTERLLRLAIATCPYWYNSRNMREGFRWLSRAVDRGRSAGASPLLLARALTDMAGGANGDDLRRTSLLWLKEAGDIQRSIEDWEGLGRTLVQYGGQLEHCGEYTAAADKFSEAAAVFHSIGDGFGEASALWNQSDLMLNVPGSIDQAETIANEALSVARRAQNPDRTALTLCGVAQILLLKRDVAGARKQLLEALELAERIGFQHLLADLLVGFAGVAEIQGDAVYAARFLGGARLIIDNLGSERFLHQGMFEHVYTATAHRLTPAAFRAAVATGRSITLPDLVVAAREKVEMSLPLIGQSDNGVALLTPRERDVLGLLCTGASNDEIAAALFISKATVKNHVGSILAKLNVKSRVAAASYAYRVGLIENLGNV
jgi:excisionase family DNA binding protein